MPSADPRTLPPLRPAGIPHHRGGPRVLVAVYATSPRPRAAPSTHAVGRLEAHSRSWTVGTLFHDTAGQRPLRWQRMIKELRARRFDGIVVQELDLPYDQDYWAFQHAVQSSGFALVLADARRGPHTIGAPPQP
ncbi:recombinase family protein [Kitasatospora sp. NPDC086791]|uniref:recombinase family protein n=1 Tax=Kitasatospora sp. NPDC086791 TaxID=3155178 RepID=UPI00344A8122